MDNRLRDILQDRKLYWVEPGKSVCQVAQTMASLGVGAVLVLEGERLRGIFSERDLMRRVVVSGLSPDRTPVEEVMTTDVATINESATSDEAMEMMQQHSCRHLPVVDTLGRVTGLISMRDLMNFELERKTDEIRHMRAYIAGNA